jgi:hypothetical protein
MNAAINPALRIELRGRRVPIGSVPTGVSCSVGQFRGEGNSFECLLPVQGTYSVLPYANFKKARAHGWAFAPLCPAPFAGLHEIEAPEPTGR